MQRARRTHSRRLHLIALRVRSEMERRRKQPRWEREFGYPVGPDLGGLCGVASDRIVALARRAGIRNVWVQDSEDGGHVFVRWSARSGEWLIDVTATQFNNRRPKVCMFKLTSVSRLPVYWRPWKEEE